ncbi:GNAT family N-acetyltransferase [Vibrio sp. OCN044]|uniref:GNAT family N-acetyltransferase n=1 Tax=Vibrio tetraodonis subsp. pristinus TaxID=2695891 RepID=A0A6L8M4Y2_9VIBR|nr:GNAT family N-acetyltransferase [Vibrio tetraodonis]MYM61239.1 GNAT family N-acetyltransferase [Vibrio tetraodonis subsp. pristinus]
MGIEYRIGTLEECVEVIQNIDEFEHKESSESLASRLRDKKYLIQVAEENHQLLGFKIGYELDRDTFYSWLGGVIPSSRKKGVAQKLLEHQEAWVRQNKYSQIRVKSRNQFPNMLNLLIRNNYLIEKYEKKSPLSESRIHFIKQILAC